jgi:drug/metabolite transporter (DMT)-like permease
MFGVILTFVGTFFDEISVTIGKKKVSEKKESVFAMGFLGAFWSSFGFLAIGLLRHNFIFQSVSLPFFVLRAVLEIAQAHIAMIAVTQSDRSTYGFVRTLTIPLLFFVDLFLGYKISSYQILGICIITITLFIVLWERNIKKKGIGLILFTAINAVFTISLYKYDITHFNSVEAEQSLINFILLFYFFFTAILFAKENPLRLFFKPIFFAQSATDGIGCMLIAFAYKFAPASIIVSVIRSSSIFWALVTGRNYFHEKHIIMKIIVLLLLIAGFVFLII